MPNIKTHVSIQTVSPPFNPARSPNTLAPTNTTKSDAQPPSISFVDKEAYRTLVSRLFGGDEAPVRDGANGMSEGNDCKPGVDFLTRQDRILLSHIYAYARNQGADLTYVDDLARELGDYRHLDDGRIMNNMNAGFSYDGQGRQLNVRFDEAHAAMVNRILSSNAIKSTLLDQGFLRFALDPGYSPYSRNSDLGFMEQIITRFSAERDESSLLDSRFMTYVPDYKSRDKIVTASETIRLAPSEEAHFIQKDDVWTVTARGKAEGCFLDPLTGRPAQGKKKPATPTPPASPFDNLIDTKPAKNRLLSLFDHLYMKMKQQGRVRQP